MRIQRFASFVHRSKYLSRLQHQRARFSDFVRALPAAVWETLFTGDGPQNVNFSSPVEASGYTAEEWKASPDLWLTILHPDDRDRVVDEFRRVCDGGGGPMTMRYRWIRKGGDIAWVEVHCVVSVDAAGRVMVMRGVTFDVTAERAAQRRLDLLARAVGSTSEQIAIIDARDRFIFVNRAFGEAHGYLEEELIGRSVRDVFENWSDLTDTERIGVRPFRSRCRDGRMLHLLVRTSHIPRQNGEVDARILIADDPCGADLERLDFESILRESEQRFRMLCQAAFDGIMIHENGIVRDVSDKCAAMFHATRAEMIGRTVFDVTAPEFHAVVRESVGRKSVAPFESVAVRPGGERFPVEVCGVNAPGSSLRVTALRDLTERKRAEEELRIREERFRDLVENSNELMCTHDLEGKLLSVNPAVSRNLGIPAEELLTMNICDILAPEALAMWPEYIAAVQREGKTAGPMTVIARNGEQRLWMYHNMLHFDRGTPVVRGLARDVTDEHRAMQALQKSEALFRSIIENAADIIGILDPEGRIRYHSPSTERVLGYDPETLNGAALLDLVHENDFHRVSEFFERQAVDPAAAYTTELRLRRRDGSWRSFEMATRNVVRGSRVEAIVVNARDVTDRRLLESQLEQANRLNALGRLSATVAHEFNNVLMGMQPFAELLERPDVSAETTLKCGRHIAGSIQRGKRVALDLLRFTQPAAPNLKPVRVAEWWEKLAPEVEAQCGNTVSVFVELPKMPLCVLADGAQLAQVVANLTNNARDAMPRGGILTIAIRQPEPGEVFPFGFVASPERFVQISCSDTGSGITAEVMPHLFEPLFTTKQNGGTGLGLAVAHQIISRHGGAIFAESDPGAGSTFHVFVPKIEGACEDVAEPPRNEHPIASRRLLIVDDEEAIVLGVSELLSAEGFEVHAVSNGGEAGEAVRRVGPDVILLDIGLPDMDGVDLGRQLRGDHPELPIIFATGHGDERVAIMDDGMRLLRKPFEIRALLDTIADLERIPT